VHTIRPVKKAFALSISLSIRWERINNANGCLDKKEVQRRNMGEKGIRYPYSKIGAIEK
jgi:hypothetical protein